ncbi:uncharacterized protein BX663DRAFT_500608 [Cokeromyces recurvatus]|uniref:uncharacterized protein n=1 Tax=Cokeromyces recurvatus TaxID=90255 RepID=UPI00222060B0|nr:uncharacterized protein BX663DRAFT_500608 [Cokeromyces recurvatus]KAI7905700.1 hypothetical protein BX663DRAFT_500608 [Cokeromyces recurvatus]
MFSAIKKNIYPAIALLTIPVGYYIGTELRERNDAKKVLKEQVYDEDEMKKLRQQLEALKEERNLVLSKMQPKIKEEE